MTTKVGPGPRYLVTIAFNHGRDEASRRLVAAHLSPRAAAESARRATGDNGWTAAIHCRDAAADAALKAEDFDAWDVFSRGPWGEQVSK